MSEKVKRYTFYGDWDREETEEGEYIKFEDYEQTKKELEELQDAVYMFAESGNDYGTISKAIEASRKRND